MLLEGNKNFSHTTPPRVHGSSTISKATRAFSNQTQPHLHNNSALGRRIIAEQTESLGWGGGIRTPAWCLQRALPYRLATPQHKRNGIVPKPN